MNARRGHIANETTARKDSPCCQRALFFNYSIDCELPPDGRFGGPASWADAEVSTRGFVSVMEQLGLRQAATLFVYPDVARHQRALFRGMADSGIEVALHLHGMRYSRAKEAAWLGSLSRGAQKEIIGAAKRDLEDTLGQSVLGYRACYASANDDTFPICDELGFAWASTSAPGTYKPENYECWAGCWPFPYHPSAKNKLVPGSLRIYEMPVTRGIRVLHEGNPDRPLDMRCETPPEIAGPGGETFRRIIEENLLEMERRAQPVRMIAGASHNTNPYADAASYQHRNLRFVCEQARACGAARGYEFIPASFLQVLREAERVAAF